MLPFLLLFLCSRSTVLFFVAFFVPRVFQSCDDELHVLYSSSDDVHSCDAPNIQYIFC